MTIGVDPRRLSAWLYFCSQNTSTHGEIMFDDTGMIAPKVLPNQKLPFDKASRWTYFEFARDSGLLKNANGNGSIYYRFQISDAGLTFIAENHVGWLARQWSRLVENALTILVSVIIALLSTWAIKALGPAPVPESPPSSQTTP